MWRVRPEGAPACPLPALRGIFLYEGPRARRRPLAKHSRPRVMARLTFRMFRTALRSGGEARARLPPVIRQKERKRTWTDVDAKRPSSSDGEGGARRP